jgi:DNA replication initiation complex subunit (GINS family)
MARVGQVDVADHYTRLLEWRREESATRGLHKLPQDFYASTEAYLAGTRATFETELRSNPGGKKGDLARQTYQRAAQVARDIVEGRMMKVLNLAFQASVGSGRDLTNALPQERALFDRLVEGLKGHRQAVSPYLESIGPTPLTPAPAVPELVPSPPTVPPGAPARGAAVVVRIVKDGRPVEIGGETIDLRKEDVLSLPAETARLLVESKVAERVETSASPNAT